VPSFAALFTGGPLDGLTQQIVDPVEEEIVSLFHRGEEIIRHLYVQVLAPNLDGAYPSGPFQYQYRGTQALPSAAPPPQISTPISATPEPGVRMAATDATGAPAPPLPADQPAPGVQDPTATPTTDVSASDTATTTDTTSSGSQAGSAGTASDTGATTLPDVSEGAQAPTAIPTSTGTDTGVAPPTPAEPATDTTMQPDQSATNVGTGDTSSTSAPAPAESATTTETAPASSGAPAEPAPPQGSGAEQVSPPPTEAT
jgi:hypothetical protein